jgi:hypothetical protein
MMYTLIVDASDKLNNVCYDRQWITIELWEDIELVYRALVWISVNSFDHQGLVCFMKAPQSHVSITQGNISMQSPDELKAHQMMERGKKGKGGFLRRCSRQMNFKKSSSKVEKELPLGGVTRQAREKALG